VRVDAIAPGTVTVRMIVNVGLSTHIVENLLARARLWILRQTACIQCVATLQLTDFPLRNGRINLTFRVAVP
jgi:predicted metal-dependent hydrolase